MKQRPNVQTWIPSALVGLALAASTSLGLAADISYTFDSDVQGWYAADGHGSVAWDSANGRGGAGCLKYTIFAATDTEVDPRVDVAYDTTGYFSVEFDMMVDPSSGLAANPSYGNLQIVARDASYSWDSMWYGAVGDVFTNGWRHVKRTFTSAYGLKAYLQMQLSTGAITGPDIIVYIDNVVIRDGTPPTHAVLYDFAWPEDCVPQSSWGAGPPVFSHDTTLTNGCLKEVADYGSGNTGWQDAPAQFQLAFDPSKYTYLDFDLYLDAPLGQPSYGQYELHYLWSWAGIGAVGLSTNNIGKWTHYSLPLPALSGVSEGLVLHPGGNNMSNVFTYYLDNITLWSPAAPPTIKAMDKETSPTGVKITMDQDAQQWQRDAICVPSGQTFYSWHSYTPVSYSFTIADFPDLVANHGFEAHLYIVNQTTIPGSSGWNQTYGGCDWNAADLLQVSIRSDTNGVVIASVDWKTNLPSANIPTNEINHPVVVTNGTTAIGTWTLTFNDNVSGTLTGPGGISTNFTLPNEVAEQFNPGTVCLDSFIQFGMFKNDGDDDGRNDGASGTFSAISMSGGLYPFSDTFTGPGLTANYAWRTSSSTAVQWIPPGVGYWLTWTTPDSGFSVQVSDNVATNYTDAGVTYTYSVGANRVGAIPAASIPAGDSVFFRLAKPGP